LCITEKVIECTDISTRKQGVRPYRRTRYAIFSAVEDYAKLLVTMRHIPSLNFPRRRVPWEIFFCSPTLNFLYALQFLNYKAWRDRRTRQTDKRTVCSA